MCAGGRKITQVRSVGKSDISSFIVTQSGNRAVPQMVVIDRVVVEAGGEDVDVENKATLAGNGKVNDAICSSVLNLFQKFLCDFLDR